jgi:hypothetical protein
LYFSKAAFIFAAHSPPPPMLIRTFHRTLCCVIMTFCCQFAQAQFRMIHLESDENNSLKHLDLYNGKEGYAVFAAGLAFTADSGKTFQPRPVSTANVNFNNYPANFLLKFSIDGVKALSRDTLFLYGDYGWEPSILYSVDNGNTFKLIYWAPLNSWGDAMHDITFPENNNVGYAVHNTTILKTIDRGKSWIINKVFPGEYLERIEGPNNFTVYAYNYQYGGKLYKTFNAGSSWAAVALPQLVDQPQRIQSLHFLTPSKGWLALSNNESTGGVYYTGSG